MPADHSCAYTVEQLRAPIELSPAQQLTSLPQYISKHTTKRAYLKTFSNVRKFWKNLPRSTELQPYKLHTNTALTRALLLYFSHDPQAYCGGCLQKSFPCFARGYPLVPFERDFACRCGVMRRCVCMHAPSWHIVVEL